MKNKIRLIKNIAFIVGASFLGYFLYHYFTKTESDFGIDDTPLKVEMIRAIAEISTVSYKDEVVQDSVEYYETEKEQISGNFYKLSDPEFWKYGLRASNIKRRLTLIVKGEVRVGFNFKNNKIDIAQNEDTIWFNLPKAKILDVLISPSGTEVFLENGAWSDGARRSLENKAIDQLKRNAEELKLKEKARESMDRLLRKLIPNEKVVLIYFTR
jgi:hypothetical protein